MRYPSIVWIAALLVAIVCIVWLIGHVTVT